jgi:hypothetical protein
MEGLQIVRGDGSLQVLFPVFALMTFGQARPPTAVPTKCTNGSRFKWTQYHGYFFWDWIDRYAGYNGAWFQGAGGAVYKVGSFALRGEAGWRALRLGAGVAF